MGVAATVRAQVRGTEVPTLLYTDMLRLESHLFIFFYIKWDYIPEDVP